MVQVVSFPGSFTHAGKDGDSPVLLGDVVDQFLDQHGLSDARTAEETDLPALDVGSQKVHNLDSRLENLLFRRLILKAGSRPVDRIPLFRLHFPGFVDRLTQHVEHAAQGGFAHRNGNRRTRVHRFHSADQTVGGSHGHAADDVVSQVQCRFHHQVDVPFTRILGLVGNANRVVDFRQMASLELDVHHGAHHLNDASSAHQFPSLFKPHPIVAGLGHGRNAMIPLQTGASFARSALRDAPFISSARWRRRRSR